MSKRCPSRVSGFFAPLCALVLMGAGCGQPAASESAPLNDVTHAEVIESEATANEIASDSVKPVRGSEKNEIALEVVDPEGYQAVLDKHNGKVVLVDFWATWCLPCKVQFPHTVELSREYADEGLAVVSMSLDEPENKDRALAFLRDQNARFDNLLSEYGGGEGSYQAYAIPGGAVPHYKVYDRKGVERYTFEVDPLAEKQFTHEDIEASVKELLTEPADAESSG